MAEKLIITEEVKKQNNMAFKMRSGNKVSFKNMGSSPAKDMKTGSYEHSFESPAKQKLNKGGEGQDQDKIFNSKGEHIGDYVNDKPVMKPGFKRPRHIPLEPAPPKDGDYEKYSDLEKYDDDNPTGKAEPPKKKKSPAKQVKTKGLGPRTAFGGVKNPELVKLKSETNSKKVMNDGPKINVTGVKNPGNWQPHPNTFKGQDHPDYRGNYDEVD